MNGKFNMGIHDYGCVLFNPESDQNIVTYQPISDNPDENLTIGQVFLENHKNLYTEYQTQEEYEDHMNEFNVVLQRQECEENSQYGDGNAYLEVIIFPSAFATLAALAVESAEELTQAIKNKTYQYRFFHPVNYSHGDWDFYELTESWLDRDNFFAYNHSTDQEMSPVWQPTLSDVEPEMLPHISPNLIKWCQLGTVWIRNWSSTAYTNFLERNKWSVEVSDLNLLAVAENLGITENLYNLTRKELFDQIKQEIAVRFWISPN